MNWKKVIESLCDDAEVARKEAYLCTKDQGDAQRILLASAAAYTVLAKAFAAGQERLESQQEGLHPGISLNKEQK